MFLYFYVCVIPLSFFFFLLRTTYSHTMSITNDLMNNHELHAVGFGVLAYAVTKKPVVGAVVGGGLYAYMKVFGHGLPTTKGVADGKFATRVVSHSPSSGQACPVSCLGFPCLSYIFMFRSEPCGTLFVFGTFRVLPCFLCFRVFPCYSVFLLYRHICFRVFPCCQLNVSFPCFTVFRNDT